MAHLQVQSRRSQYCHSSLLTRSTAHLPCYPSVSEFQILKLCHCWYLLGLQRNIKKFHQKISELRFQNIGPFDLMTFNDCVCVTMFSKVQKIKNPHHRFAGPKRKSLIAATVHRSVFLTSPALAMATRWNKFTPRTKANPLRLCGMSCANLELQASPSTFLSSGPVVSHSGARHVTRAYKGTTCAPCL